jgi:hypothetical protein
MMPSRTMSGSSTSVTMTAAVARGWHMDDARAGSVLLPLAFLLGVHHTGKFPWGRVVDLFRLGLCRVPVRVPGRGRSSRSPPKSLLVDLHSKHWPSQLLAIS